ncbi:MAG: MarR family transcriptional regulator [Clostridium beijerinckii]|jgi:DNA-binding MarR family transcriptional regulator|uniref:MarR family transcriptional regulator n=1 Tax=Clostridium beijerinckii TaxID=1520 RepID=UPI001493EF9F|nr:MarR family transcriptional regulator [Clostridium beijerinckii]MCI1579802.1 MarR family transcriptional regulator [Clostridium beijerinckii]MCI1581740.1 MarR family transcriptional regulator [Clostridium beijerinckii]MCI1622587.1 MarR family transcriptional regulator [Clostridium beijerinckii]MDG5854847.1 MarR family transcriptional regulator [Clostridium beijerinckii]NOW82471.1 DNA-binding MarR family transcriptional regulator [Clostridium beijerinckii]
MDIVNEIIFSLKKIQENNEIDVPNIKNKLTFSQIHCIAAIEYIEDANITKLSQELGMTTGAITKMCKKLLNEGYVSKYQKEGNNKEVYYDLTELGLNVSEIHKKIHEKSYNKKKHIIEQYNDEEKAIILRFLDDMNSVTKDTFQEITEKYIKSDN